MADVMQVLIPGSLAFIMLGMGMGLKVADFTRLLRIPRAVGIGLASQILLLPVVAVALIQLFPMREAFAIGLLIIALTPGGAVSNLWTYLARGDIALSVTLTACSSMLAVFTVPLLLNLALFHLFAQNTDIRLPVGETMLHIALITVIPVSIGMMIHARFESFTRRVEGVVRILSILFLVMAIGGIIFRERSQVLALVMTAGLPVLLYNFTVMAAGFTFARVAKLPRRQVITIAIEVGIQNVILTATLAVAPQFLGRTDIGLLPSVYGFTMSFFVLGFIVLVRRFPALLGDADETSARRSGALIE